MAFILFYIGFYSIAATSATGAVARTSLLLLLPVRVVCRYCNPVAAYAVAVVSNSNSDSNSNRKILAE